MKQKTKQINRWMIIVFAGLLAVGAGRPARCAGAPPVLGEILKKTESYYQQVHAFTSYFQQRTTSSAATAVTTEASGRLYYQKPRQMRWEYDKPEPQVFVANQQLAWLYVPSEAQISLLDPKSFFSSPLAQTFFDGFVELKKHFEVSLDPKQSSKVSAVLKLVPKQEDPNIESLFLWIDLNTYRILVVETHDALGNRNRIELDSQKAADHLDPKLFQLDIPPSTAVLDVDGRAMTPANIEKLRLGLPPTQEKNSNGRKD